MKIHTGAYARFALTHVAVAALSLACGSAMALGLGRLTVQSALGETLRAEIDVSSLSAEEAATLKLRVAPPEVYKSSGIEYNAVLSGAQVQLARRADGRPVLRLSSDRAVQEPFIDVVLELNSSSGRLVREYTLLFDPPAPTRTAAAPEINAAPVMAAAPAETSPVAAPRPAPAAAPVQAPVRAPKPAEAPRVAEPKPAPVPAPVPAPAPRPEPRVASTPAGEYQVKPGDSLSRIASKTQPAGISLDQMLVGLYRNNPEAFLDNNMNRLKAGVVLQVPSSEALASLTPAEARQVIQAQSADFNSYRQRLAAGAPLIPSEGSERQAKGKVQAEVAERKPTAPVAPDKLTLSKPSAPAAEQKVSKDTERKDSAARVAELTRNVEELKKLSSAAKPEATPAPAPAPAPAPVAAPAPAPAPVVAAAPAPVAAPVASAPASEAAPVVAAPKPAASKPVPKPAAAVPPAAEEPSFFDELLSSSLLLPLGAGLLAVVGVLGFLRSRNRKPDLKAETAFTESRLAPDSFFGASGGQRVDTRDGSSSQSSMSYSLSQLDAIGDVDPVAEADVYLAYGRDLQAEEILKEALRSNPERMAIRLKLLEVYAKRRDVKGFEQLAIQLYAETHGQGEDWAKAQEMGRQVDPENPLYQPGGAPQLLNDNDPRPEPMDASTLPATGAHLSTEPIGRPSDPGPSSIMGLELDLDLGSPSPTAMEATQALATSVEQAPMAMDFEIGAPSPANDQAKAAAKSLEFDLDELGDFDQATVASPLQVEPGAGGGLDFDLSSIDLDLPELPPAATPVAAPAPSAADTLADAMQALAGDDGDPLLRQLELAEEFRQIGDVEGARDVLQELVGKASGPLRDRAQAMLDELR